MNSFSIAIHGGAGTISRNLISPEQEAAYLKALSEALLAGESVLKSGGSAIDAISASVVCLEDCPLFNAGKGSVFTADERHEMDAAIMEGNHLKAGAVAGVSNVRNPLLLARAVMEKSEHVLLSGKGAEAFGRSIDMRFEDSSYFYDEFRHQQWEAAVKEGIVQLDHSIGKEKKFGTVGAVALDNHGNLAAATSTGGMTNKRFNRIGDSPVIGSGTYANNNTCAVSCTGHGEYFIRAVVAYDVSCLMEYKGMSLEEATRLVVMEKLVRLGGEGGLIAVDTKGNIAMPFNSEGMYRGFCRENEELQVAIYK